MLVARKKCKNVNAYVEIYDDNVQPERTEEILDRCAEICSRSVIAKAVKDANTA